MQFGLKNATATVQFFVPKKTFRDNLSFTIWIEHTFIKTQFVLVFTVPI